MLGDQEQLGKLFKELAKDAPSQRETYAFEFLKQLLKSTCSACSLDTSLMVEKAYELADTFIKKGGK